MGIRTFFSTKETAQDAVEDLKRQSTGITPKLVVFFASSKFDSTQLAAGMKTAFGTAATMGCSTAGEIISGKMLTDSVVAMFFDSDIIDTVYVEPVSEIKTADRIPEVFSRFEKRIGTPMANLDIEKYVGIILIDGLSGMEETIMGKIGDRTNVTFIGGSAGDDLKFKQTFVYADGKADSNAAILALLKVKNGFDIIKTQSFRPTGKKLIATKVDEASRRVLKFNDLPAVQAYCSALGCDELQAAEHFMSNPVGLMIGNEPYVRSPQRIDNGTMVFYCNIKEGMQLEILNATDIVKDTQEAVERARMKHESISGIIDFHCILRTLELRQKKMCPAYGAVFSDIPTIGFSTYGEEYIGHINQTSTMLVFK